MIHSIYNINHREGIMIIKRIALYFYYIFFYLIIVGTQVTYGSTHTVTPQPSYLIATYQILNSSGDVLLSKSYIIESLSEVKYVVDDIQSNQYYRSHLTQKTITYQLTVSNSSIISGRISS